MATGIHLRDARGPEGVRIYAIGDIHGRLDLLLQLHKLIRHEIERDGIADWRIIHLGDYVDRGPDTRGVIDLLMAERQADERNVMLAGNHDWGFLEFLDNPDGAGLFARYGGRETAASYGVEARFDNPDAVRLTWAELRSAVPGSHRAFLASLGHSEMHGDFFFCHGGIRPGVPFNEQDPQDLMWMRKGFLDFTQLHPKVVVHGHTIVPEPEVLANRIDIDTGAYASGVLTALVIDGGEKRFVST